MGEVPRGPSAQRDPIGSHSSHLEAARAGPLDQRLRAQVRAGLSRHRLADLPEKADLAKDLVFEESYLGKTDSTFILNFSTRSSMVLAQYYNFASYGRADHGYIMQNMQTNAGSSRRSSRGPQAYLRPTLREQLGGSDQSSMEGILAGLEHRLQH
jgi:hypothetical protein